jgi:hypothetical protein
MEPQQTMEQIMERKWLYLEPTSRKWNDDQELRTTEEKIYREKLMTLFGASEDTQEETMACQE